MAVSILHPHEHYWGQIWCWAIRIWLYNSPPATASQISLKEATEHAVHSMARNSTRSHISGNRGYESNRVCFLSIFHSYCKYRNQFNHAVLWCGRTRNQGSRGIRLRGVNRVHQAQGEPWGSPVAWVSSRKWYLASIQLWTDQAKRGLNNIGQGPASHLTNLNN